MSSEREGGRNVFACDSCGETFTSEERDFIGALNEAKREGWQPYKIGHEWCHACPNCEVER